MKEGKIKLRLMEILNDKHINLDNRTFNLVFSIITTFIKRMIAKNNKQGQKISTLEAELEHQLKVAASLREDKEHIKNFSKNSIDELSKCLEEEKTKRNNDMTTLRSAMRSQTDTILALRDENEKLRGVKDEAYIKRVELTQKILDKDKDNDQLRKRIAEQWEIIEKLNNQLHKTGDYITKVPPGFYDVVNTINENERFKKVIAHSADRIVELEMQNKDLNIKLNEVRRVIK